MNKTYRHRAMAIDEYVGRVSKEGKVYETRLGPDTYVGRVNLDTGKVYEARLGPDKVVGSVEADTGKVYLDRLGPDEYLGRVDEDGKCYLHKRLARDEYLGKVNEMTSFLHGGAAFLLLILPHLEEAKEAQEKEARQALENQLDAGSETAES